MMKILLLLTLSTCISICLAGPGATSEHLKIDQFGYQTGSSKICVISNPQIGFNAALSFAPGATYEVRRWSDDVVVFSGNITAWNGGATHAQSGDQVWWFDFSPVNTPDDYYIYDPANAVGSYRFTIADEVYAEVLKEAIRTFYYQRCGVAKTAAFGGVWSDLTACHVGGLQDLDARLISSPNDATTSMDLSGGWHDAGDYTKYVNFTYSVLHSLLFAYQENPIAFTDDYNIPESGNGIPDLLDETKFELDWLLKMQLPDGSVLMKIGSTGFQGGSPPSGGTYQRLYGPAQASSTRTTASILAHASVVYRSLNTPVMNTFADTLEARAVRAWNWVQLNPANSNYNNAGFSSANPEVDATEQDERLMGAAAMLYAATGGAAYRTYFENNYTAIRPYSWGYWYPFQSTIQDIMLYYSSLGGVSAGVATNIRNNCTNSANTNNGTMLPAWQNGNDAYRAYLDNNNYVWGSNMVKANKGSIFYNMIQYNLDPGNAGDYQDAAGSYIHYLHGINPLGLSMLTNMSTMGAENSAKEMYHAWFGDGTNFDNAVSSLYGPAPGFLTGGVNPNFTPDGACACTLSPPENQPIQKSYLDWNTSWPENSWEVTEPAIYYQAAYIKLLSKFVVPAGALPVEVENFVGNLTKENTVALDWRTESEINAAWFEIERSVGGAFFEKIGQVAAKGTSASTEVYHFIDTEPFEGKNYYRLKQLDLDGKFTYSRVVTVWTKPSFSVEIFPNPATSMIQVEVSQIRAPGNANLFLYDPLGRETFVSNSKLDRNFLKKEIEIRQFLPGIYVLVVEINGNRTHKRVVIDRAN